MDDDFRSVLDYFLEVGVKDWVHVLSGAKHDEAKRVLLGK